MFVLGNILILIGLFMIVNPSIFWKITESWKSSQASDPSGLYIWSTRFGGVMFTIVGISTVVIAFL
ncbi:hypothetical protein IMZ08_14060 [Bacillus luteolus]|uniref:DUF6199 domain-containing protein n=1 Tax=Litchfieldia luteola TaxID=682179 RepID=A0ABR9QL10_9BACI|nr:DUF6199 family natural product biosynthesis protein [Cytobacillus luteolus]MBE4909187.1 hypothetical protein [Cytobacillus luteolus]MBP1940360.1 hypothetical protein [Cytobacillus luteolus]